MNRIVVDWGTSSFRAYRFAADGTIAHRHRASAGILTVSDGDFESVLMREIGALITPDTDVFFSGMITSRNGWVETPYLELPADIAGLADSAVERRARNGARLLFLPGLCARDPLPDVMRGEEIQVFGTVGRDEDARVVLPGTHSKWVEVQAGRITGFRTFFTGEMFAVLKQNSILGRLVPAGEAGLSEPAFRAGVKQAASAHSAGLLNDIFTTRAGVLLGNFPAAEIADRLSGMLIGHEIIAALAGERPSTALYLVGEAGLVARYRLACETLGVSTIIGPEHAAVDGFRRLGMLGNAHG